MRDNNKENRKTKEKWFNRIDEIYAEKEKSYGRKDKVERQM